MVENLYSKKIPVILILFILVTPALVFINSETQASEIGEFPYPGDDWSWSMIGTQYAHQLGEKGDDVLVAVLDTGIDYTHPDLEDKMWDGIGYDFVNGDEDPMDEDGHGTHVAGIISSVAPEAELMALKVIEEEGGSWQQVSEAIRFARDNGADIITMSFGGERSPLSRAVEIQINFAHDRDDILFVSSAGNDNTDDEYYPAAYDNVIAVSAIDSNKEKASYSNYGDWIELTAPGGDSGDRIMSTLPGGDHGEKMGTSMSCPYVAGVAALRKGAFPDSSNQDMRQSMWDTAIELEGPQVHFGHGLVNAYRAAGGVTPTPPINLKGESADSRIELNWEEPWDQGITDIEEYHIYRGTSPEVMDIIYETEDAYQNEYLDEDVINDQLYYYHITALNSEGESYPSEEITIVPRESPTHPSEPRNLEAEETTEGIRLTWDKPFDDGGSTLTEYRIYVGTESDDLDHIVSIDPSESWYLDRDVETNTTYHYAVTAVNEEGESGFSNQISQIYSLELDDADPPPNGYPPLQPYEDYPLIPFVNMEPMIFILIVVFSISFAWLTFVYYSEYKRKVEREKKKRRNQKSDQRKKYY